MNKIESLLDSIARSGESCGCDFPCRCNGPEWEAINMECMKDMAWEALELLERQKVMDEELLNITDNGQEVDFVFQQEASENLIVGQYPKELQKLKAFSTDLWNILAENGCWIAGGAITSVFTGKAINDFDIYFPNKEAFTNVMAEIYSHENINYGDAIVKHMTNKSVLITSDECDVQFIVFKFFDNVEQIFNSFDFTCVMGAVSMKDETFHMHKDFLKHNAQRFLKFNSGTDYPLISMLRVDKYKERGYTTSKQEMLKIGMAIASKDYSTWEKVKDEVGSMYGLREEEIFDTSKEFSLSEVISQLDQLFIPKNYKTLEVPYSFKNFIEKMPDKFSDVALEYSKQAVVKTDWGYDRETPYFDWLDKREKAATIITSQTTEGTI